MIVKKNIYRCQKCGKFESYIDGDECEKKCSRCGNCNLDFKGSINADTELAEQRRQEEARRDAANKSGFVFVQCPYCQSHDTKKITSASRVASVGLFGLGSKKLGKQWHCNKCGSDF